jgi:hypothetical protein
MKQGNTGYFISHTHTLSIKEGVFSCQHLEGPQLGSYLPMILTCNNGKIYNLKPNVTIVPPTQQHYRTSIETYLTSTKRDLPILQKKLPIPGGPANPYSLAMKPKDKRHITKQT